jgi:hypothetical protein
MQGWWLLCAVVDVGWSQNAINYIQLIMNTKLEMLSNLYYNASITHSKQQH